MMKFRDIINYLNATDSCIITVVNRKSEEVIDDWEGSIITIPWYYMDYLLYNESSNYEAICVEYKDGKPYFDITLCELL